MSVETVVDRDGSRLGWRLANLYLQCGAWYVLAMVVLWLVGVEGIYDHPTPFYAYILPAVTSPITPLVAGLFAWAITLVWRRWTAGRERPASRGFRFAGIGLGAAAAVVCILFVVRARVEQEPLLQAVGAVWTELRWHLLALALFVGSLALWRYAVVREDWFERSFSPRARRGILAGLVLFSILFSAGVAMLRNGPAGITAAYERHQHEYIDDIGRGRSIRGLLRDYNELHPHLSTHAKVHPPGPIVVLWMLSYAVLSRGPLMLSLATIVAGSLGVIPLFYWVRDLTSERTAFTCSFLYVLVPTTVLFTATSADILFIPFVTATLFTFWRALDRSAMASLGYAAAAGILYAILSLLSFSLIGLGAFFGLAGLWRLTQRGKRAAVVRTGVVMVAAFLLTHLAVRLWSGFDVVACFHICKAQFDEDQLNLNIFRPRYPSWVYRFLNPACWAFFAGVPVTVLFVWRLFRPEKDTRGLFVVFALTLVALDLLYLARGEGERSAMYILPFMAVPAAHLLDQLGRRVRSTTPLTVTLVFLAFQCWLIEVCLYTYW